MLMDKADAKRATGEERKLKDRGIWKPDVSYKTNDLVIRGGVNYVLIAVASLNQEPGSPGPGCVWQPKDIPTAPTTDAPDAS